MSHSAVSIIPLLVIFIPMFLVGVFIFRRGLRANRRGDTPYCRKCNYNLTGNTSQRCPECGTDLSPETIVVGSIRRSPLLILVGCVCMMPGIFIGFRALGEVNWYQLKPTALLISDIQSTSPAKVAKAWREIDRRKDAGKLSSGHTSKLITISLSTQKKALTVRNLPNLSMYLDFLGDAYLDKQLTEEQSDQFFQQMVSQTLEVRSDVPAGEEVPARMSDRALAPSGGWKVVVRDEYSLVDGENKRKEGSSCSYMGLGGSGSRGLFVKAEPGKHTLTAVSSVTIYSNCSNDYSTCTFEYEYELKQNTEFEVLAETPEDYITMIHDPSLELELMESIIPECFTPCQYRSDCIEGRLNLSPLPMNVAFQIFMVQEGVETKISTLVRSENEGSTNWGFSWEHKGPVPDRIDLIFRSDETLVSRSIDMYDAWEGELIIEDIPISTNSIP